MSEFDQLQVNVWVCGNEVLRCVVNPFTPARIPYQAFPFEINPYQIWGVGVAENMEDAQLLMNGHVRMAIDNLALAGNLVFDVDEASLVPGQNMDIFPGKIFRRQSGVTGTAINGLKFPNTAPENIQMYQISRQLADEETGIPSIMHGQTGVTGTGSVLPVEHAVQHGVGRHRGGLGDQATRCSGSDAERGTHPASHLAAADDS